jgi:hypothetical protein
MNEDLLLHRVIESFEEQSGEVSSQEFRPLAKDYGQLSVYDSTQFTAEEAWQHYRKDLSRPAPIGVLSLSVRECQDLGLPVRQDPDTFLGHALIDFRELTGNQQRRISRRLRDFAVARDWQYRSPD